jgi:hypothetical protein
MCNIEEKTFEAKWKYGMISNIEEKTFEAKWKYGMIGI